MARMTVKEIHRYIENRTAHNKARYKRIRQEEKKLARRNKLIFLMCVGLILLAGVLSYYHEPTSIYDYSSTFFHHVQQNETLWSIASQHSTNSHATDRVIHIIRQLNDMTGSTIYIGQSLEVPIFDIMAGE